MLSTQPSTLQPHACSQQPGGRGVITGPYRDCVSSPRSHGHRWWKQEGTLVYLTPNLCSFSWVRYLWYFFTCSRLWGSYACCWDPVPRPPWIYSVPFRFFSLSLWMLFCAQSGLLFQSSKEEAWQWAKSGISSRNWNQGAVEGGQRVIQVQCFQPSKRRCRKCTWL